MKRFLSLILVAGTIFLFGCTKSGPAPLDTTTAVTTGAIAPERKTYESTSNDIVIQFPGTRTFQENVYGSMVMFFTPVTSGDTLKENVGIIKKDLDKTYTLDEYYAIIKPELIKIIPGFAEVTNETININGIDGKKLIYTGTQGGTELEWEQIYIIQDKAVYIITYTAIQTTFNDFVQQVDEMAATLEIK